MYTRPHDYKLYCDTTTLTQVVNADLSLKRLCEYAVEDQIKSYLKQRYNFDKPYGEFTDTDTYSNTTTYRANNRVYLDASTYAAGTAYSLNDLVLSSGSVYVCIQAGTGQTPSSSPLYWTLLGTQYDLFYITLPYDAWDFQKEYVEGEQIWYKDKTYTASIPSTNIPPDSTYGSNYWGTGTTYTVTAGTLPTDTTKWTAGDNRNNYLLQLYIELVIHAMFKKVAPRNIPETREVGYDRAIQWLKDAGSGLVTADLPLIVPEQGSSIRWGSIDKTNNLY
jgi:hypothetical protein